MALRRQVRRYGFFFGFVGVVAGVAGFWMV
jgi:hypothetical protein